MSEVKAVGWAQKRAFWALVDAATNATAALFAIVDEEDHELANAIDEARAACAKVAEIVLKDRRT